MCSVATAPECTAACNADLCPSNIHKLQNRILKLTIRKGTEALGQLNHIARTNLNPFLSDRTQQSLLSDRRTARLDKLANRSFETLAISLLASGASQTFDSRRAVSKLSPCSHPHPHPTLNLTQHSTHHPPLHSSPEKMADSLVRPEVHRHSAISGRVTVTAVMEQLTANL